MIHDFAKLPRTYELSAPASTSTRPRFRRRYLLGLVLVVAGAVIAWQKLNTVPVAKPEFHPGQKESSDYQAAMAEEKVEDATPQSHQVAKATTTHEVAVNTPAVTAKTPIKAKKVEKPKEENPKYGFYDNLTHSTWSVPIMRGVYVSSADRKRMENQRFMLQAASVREVEDARRLVQKLRQAGLNATYTTTDQNGGWNRINVGPFENVSMMNKAEDTLVSLGMMPIIRKIP